MKTVDDTTHRLLLAVDDVRELLPTLQAMLGEPDNAGPKSGTIGRKPDGSEPWNSPAAGIYFSIWHGAADIVLNLRWDIGLKGATTMLAGPDGLDAIVNLAPTCSDQALQLATRQLERWADQARQLPAIDESEPWVPVPSQGPLPPPCPFCHTYGLRMKRRRGEVCCFYPGCADGDGNQ